MRDGELRDAAEAAMALLLPLPAHAQAEISRALAAQVGDPRPAAADVRVAELGALAALLNEIADPTERTALRTQAPPLPQAIYDAQRPLGAPTSDWLSRKYDGWLKARRAAWGLLPDGRHAGPGRPWACPVVKPPISYQREDCVRSVRECALALGRLPSSADYVRWRRAVLDRARSETYHARRLAPYQVIKREFGNFKSLVLAASITERELLDARAAWAGPGRQADLDRALSDRLRELGDDAWERVGLTIEERSIVIAGGAGRLPIDQAITLAQQLGVSLDFLAAQTSDPGEPPPPGAAFDGGVVSSVRHERGISETDLMDQMGWTRSVVRRVTNGALHPTLDQVRKLVRILAPDPSADLVGLLIDGQRLSAA